MNFWECIYDQFCMLPFALFKTPGSGAMLLKKVLGRRGLHVNRYTQRSCLQGKKQRWLRNKNYSTASPPTENEFHRKDSADVATMETWIFNSFTLLYFPFIVRFVGKVEYANKPLWFVSLEVLCEQSNTFHLNFIIHMKLFLVMFSSNLNGQLMNLRKYIASLNCLL